MKRCAIVPLLAFLLAPARDQRATVPADYVTPQSTVSSYWHRMIEHRHRDALECFVEGTRDASGVLALPDLVELRARDFKVQWRRGGAVDLLYEVEYRVALGDSLQRFSTGDRLELTGSGWKIAHPLLFASRR